MAVALNTDSITKIKTLAEEGTGAVGSSNLGQKDTNTNTFSLRLHKEKSKEVIEKMYKDSDVHLDRKYNLYKEIYCDFSQ